MILSSTKLAFAAALLLPACVSGFMAPVPRHQASGGTCIYAAGGGANDRSTHLIHPPPSIHNATRKTVRALAASAVAPAPFKTDKSNAIFEEAKVHTHIKSHTHQSNQSTPCLT